MAHIVYYRTQHVKGVFSLFQQRKEQQEINIGNGIESTVMSVMTSLPVDPDRALMVVRAHWGIENLLHWTLDVTFGEDYCTARTLHAAENRATLTRIAVNLLNRCARKHKCGTKKARMMANQSPEALEEMLAA